MSRHSDVNWRTATSLLVIGLILLFGISLIEPANGNTLGATTQILAPPADISGFARAIDAREWQFPRDHGAHPAFQTEWWYYTGNLATDEGRRFSYQFTIFRRALTPLATRRDSEFRANDIYMAHFTLSDIKGGDFFHDVRYARGGAELAGATADPHYRVWLEDWQVRAENDEATQTRITAASADFAIDLRLRQVKPPALQGDKGLSPKSAEIGNASYYYSLSRLLTSGRLSIGAEAYTVEGATWMDHEFSTSALGVNARGWDWFGLTFNDDSELMAGQIRLTDGGIEPAFGGLLIAPDGSTRQLSAEEIQIAVSDTWLSPHSSAEYPAGWDITISGPGGFRIAVAPLMPDQELHGAGIIYWEGAVSISGDKSGYGYAELTGYAASMQNRF